MEFCDGQQIFGGFKSVSLDLTTGFAPFGGWSAPIAHQYAGKVTTDKCAPGVNINYSYYKHGTFQKKNGNKKFMSRN
uniref:Uncharacterized protein n=1 Tax=Acrobeloides nanus TaxID=290746 RepID=A0A914E6F7_9BILA